MDVNCLGSVFGNKEARRDIMKKQLTNTILRQEGGCASGMH